MKVKALPLVAALTLALGSGAASALTYFPGQGTAAGTKYEDSNLDWFIDNDQDGKITVGDRLISVLEFDTANDILAPISPMAPLNIGADELVGVADITLTGFDGFGRWIFSPSAGMGNTMISVYSFGSSTDLDIGTYANCNSLASCQAAVTDGTHLADFGMADADDEWLFVGTHPSADTPATVAAASELTPFGSGSFALSLIGTSVIDFQNLAIDCGNFTCAGDGLTTIAGNIIIYGGGGAAGAFGATGAFATSDTDVSVNIPEPATLALLGMGLLGMGALRRRRED